MNISVAIPVYNSEKNIPDLTERLVKVLEHMASNYEIIYVNDGSQDSSWQIICELVERFNYIKGINLMRNTGQHNALLCAIREAKYEIIVTMDDDLQHPPEEIPKLINEFSKGYDVVYGAPKHEKHGLFRDLASKIIKLALRIAVGAKIDPMFSAFRVFRTELRNAFANYTGPFLSIDVLLSWGTVKFRSIYVNHELRKHGESNYTFQNLVRYTSNIMTGFSVLPLQSASLVGFFFAFFGILVLAYVLIKYLILGVVVPGFIFMASIIAIFSGAQLFALGIFGEYLAKMHFRLMGRPTYMIKEIHERT